MPDLDIEVFQSAGEVLLVYYRLLGSGYGYGTVPGARCRWAIDTEGGHVVVSVSLIRNGYEYGRRSRGRFRIPPAIVAICRCL